MGIIHYGQHRLKPYFSLANLLVSVLRGSRRVLAVIDMQRLQPIHTYDSIKLVKHSRKIIFDIVAGIADMAGVQAHAKLILELNSVDNRT